MLLNHNTGLQCMLIGMLLVCPALSAQDTAIVVDDSFAVLDLAAHLRICPADVQTPQPGDTRCVAGTEKSIEAARQMLVYPSPLWSFLELQNVTERERFLVLEHHLAITEKITLQDMALPEATAKVAGETVSIQSRDFHATLPAFSIVLKPRERKVFRLSIASDIVTRPGFTLYSQEKFYHERQKGNWVHASFYGLMLSMIFYNLLLFVRLRQSIFLIYVFFILSLTTMYAGLYGHGFAFFWQDWYKWQKYSHSVAKFAAAVFGIAFFSAVLNVKTRMPRLHRATRPVYAVILAIAGISPLLSPQLIFVVATIVVTFAVLYSLALGVLSVTGKLPFNIFYAIAMLSMLSGALVNLLQTASLLPSNTFTIHAMQVGTALETIFLSLALGDRYSAIESENRALQLQRLEDKKRIARDIHDVVGTEFQMRLLEISGQADSAMGIKVSDGLRSTLNKVREFLFLLHTDENLPSNLEPNIRAVVARLETTKKFQIDSYIRVAPDVLHTADAYHLERAVDEIVSNLVRHAKANSIRFRLCVRQRRGFLAVKDNGVGFDARAVVKNIGLESLKYRAERLGGRLRLVTKPGAGTTAAIRFKTRR